VSLTHDAPHCTGRWKLHVLGNRLCWRCERCWAITRRSDSVDEAAQLENQLGFLLRHLAATGQRILDGEGQRW
jgi:hypothetical protein